jgi:hypothetical protein
MDEFNSHLRRCHPGEVSEPGIIYNIKLVLDYIRGGAPVRTVEKYARDFVAERAVELGKVEEWEDLCGRRARLGWCRCDE